MGLNMAHSFLYKLRQLKTRILKSTVSKSEAPPTRAARHSENSAISSEPQVIPQIRESPFFLRRTGIPIIDAVANEHSLPSLYLSTRMWQAQAEGLDRKFGEANTKIGYVRHFLAEALSRSPLEQQDRTLRTSGGADDLIIFNPSRETAALDGPLVTVCSSPSLPKAISTMPPTNSWPKPVLSDQDSLREMLHVMDCLLQELAEHRQKCQFMASHYRIVAEYIAVACGFVVAERLESEFGLVLEKMSVMEGKYRDDDLFERERYAI